MSRHKRQDDIKPEAPIHIRVRTRLFHNTTLSLLPSFTGIIRVACNRSHIAYQPPPIQLDNQIQRRATHIPNRSPGAPMETFVGDVATAGYLKGMSNDDWHGNIVDVEVEDGRLHIIAAATESPPTPSRTTPTIEPIGRRAFDFMKGMVAQWLSRL